MTTTNTFSMGAQVGGPNVPRAILQQQQQLRDRLNSWVGDYATGIREFAFLLRVDGSIHTYTEMWNIRGAQSAKLKKTWIEVEIGVPEDWWREGRGMSHKQHLADAIEKGLHSMIEVLQRKGFDVRAGVLLTDWAKIKTDYLKKGPSETPQSDK